MSRFNYKLFINEKFEGNFTSINDICNYSFYLEANDHKTFLTPESRNRLLTAFRVKYFERMYPKIYVDDTIGLKVVSDYMEFTGYLPSQSDKD
jgi:hypothetical protein